MKMLPTLPLVAAAVAMLSHTAFAQQTREERKADTAAAVKAGETPKAGEGGPNAGKPMQSTKSREQRKAETAAAVKAKETPKGEDQPAMTNKSTKTRAERKAETAAAVKAGETPKAGEAPAGQKK